MKYEQPILASSVDWSTTTGTPPMSGTAPDFSNIAIGIRNNFNGETNEVKKKGKYIGNEYPLYKDRIYTFLVNKNNNGPMIGNNHYVCIPCPDFCSGGLDSEVGHDEKEEFYNGDKTKNILELVKGWDIKKIGLFFQRRYFPKTFFSDSNNLFDFYNKFNYQTIRKFELELVMAVLSYTFHQYEDAKVRFKLLNQKHKNFKSFQTIKSYFQDIDQKIKFKQKRNNFLEKSKNITVLQCDNEFDGFLYNWHDRIYNIIKESNLRHDYTGEDDYLESHESRFHINEMNSSLFNDFNEMINKIPKETQILIMQCHGDHENLLHYYSDIKSFKGRPTKVPITAFMNKLNSIPNKPDLFMCFSCDSTQIIKSSTIVNTIGCNGPYNITLTLPYCLSFFASIIFENDITANNYAGIKQIHERAKVLSNLFTQTKFTFEIK